MPTTSAPAVSAALATPAAANARAQSARAQSACAQSVRVNRRPHPNLAALKDRAFALTCTGLRSPAIALQLGVPERTIRRWVNGTLLSLAQDALDPDCGCDPAASATSGASAASGASSQPSDPTTPTDAGHAGAAQNASSPAAGDTFSSDDTADPATRPTPIPLERHRALAIERQLAVAITAHAAYDRLMARHDDLLDSLTAVLRDNLLPDTNGAAAPASLPPAAALLTRLIAQLESGATRHLRIVQTAQREAARFQGVPAYAQTDARLTATEAHADANAEPEDDEQEGGHVPIEWVDPNDPTKEGLIPRSTFDANAAIDDLCNSPRSSLDRLQQTGGAANTEAGAGADDDEDADEQDEEAILAAIIAEQTTDDSPATGAPSATAPATVPATTPATGAATTPATGAATALDERPIPYSDGDAEFERDPWGVYEERQRERRITLMESLASTRLPPTLPRSNTVAALFLRNPHYVF